MRLPTLVLSLLCASQIILLDHQAEAIFIRVNHHLHHHQQQHLDHNKPPPVLLMNQSKHSKFNQSETQNAETHKNEDSGVTMATDKDDEMQSPLTNILKLRQHQQQSASTRNNDTTTATLSLPSSFGVLPDETGESEENSDVDDSRGFSPTNYLNSSSNRHQHQHQPRLLGASKLAKNNNNVIDIIKKTNNNNNNHGSAAVMSPDKADSVADRADVVGFSHGYHRKVFGVSVGMAVLACAILSLVGFVMHAKYRYVVSSSLWCS